MDWILKETTLGIIDRLEISAHWKILENKIEIGSITFSGGGGGGGSGGSWGAGSKPTSTGSMRVFFLAWFVSMVGQSKEACKQWPNSKM